MHFNTDQSNSHSNTYNWTLDLVWYTCESLEFSPH